MVKSERGAKSQAVRDYLKDNRKAGPKEVVDALKAQGVEVTATLVSNIKYGKRGAGKGRRGRRKENASSHIRAYLEQNPAAKPKEIKDALAKQGLKVATGLISNVKYHFEKKGPVKAGRGSARRADDGSLPSVDQLLQVKDLANSMGGLDQLRRAAEALAQLQ